MADTKAHQSIPLTKGKFAIVDEADYEWLSQWKWFVRTRRQYASRDEWDRKKSRNRCIYMHRQILNAPSNMQVDHINGNTLDNRRSNLRLCTSRQNTQAQAPQPGFASKYKGVSRARYNKWRAYIRINGVQTYLGHYDSQEDAAWVYNEMATIYFGQFARLNTIGV